jgi:hypothetical protein
MAEVANHDAAIWIAREIGRNRRGVKHDTLRLVGLWAWFSVQPDTFGHSMIERCWTPNLGFQSALEAAKEWQRAVDLHVHLGNESIGELWLQPARIGGYDFRPLASASDIFQEAKAMGNCLRTYGWSVANNHARLWSMRCNGERVATLQIGFRGPLPHLVQLRGARNSEVQLAVWQAARQWLHMQDWSPVDPKRLRGRVALDRSAWTSLWRPYWVGKRRIPAWLPLAPSRTALEALEVD